MAQPWPDVSRPVRFQRAVNSLNRLRAEALADIDASEIDCPVWSVSDRGTAGAFRSSRTDRGAQVLPLGGATVPPWLPAKSARVSNLPACRALGPACFGVISRITRTAQAARHATGLCPA